jgi:MFS-type transporter involved in bile tolerance (Atg22 family)
MGTLHEHLYVFMIISVSVLLRMRNVADKFVDKVKALVLSSVPFSVSRTIYEIMLKNMVEPDRPHNIIQCMRFCVLDN